MATEAAATATQWKYASVTEPYFHSFKAWSPSFKFQSSRISKITKPFRLLSSDWTTGYPREVVREIRPLCATAHRRRLQNRWDCNFSRNCQIYTKDGLHLQPIEALHWELFLSNMVIKYEYQLASITISSFFWFAPSPFSRQFSHSFFCTRFWIKAGLAPVLRLEG